MSTLNHTPPAFECFFLPEPEFHLIDERRVTNLVTAIINSVFSPVAVIANILVVIVIARTNSSLQSPSNVLLACLAFSDFLVGLVVQPCYVIFRLMENASRFVHCAFRVVYSESFWICYGVSFMTLSALSIERYLGLRLHLRYKEVITIRRVLIVIAIIWIVDVLLTSLQWIGHDNYVRNTQLIVFLVCILLTFLAHLKIFSILHRHQRQIETQAQEISFSNAGRNNFHSARQYQVQIKLAVNAFYIVGFYLLFNIPVMIVTLCEYIRGNFFTRNVFSWVETVAFLNSSLNPIVCCWRNKNIRRKVFRLLNQLTCNVGLFGGMPLFTMRTSGIHGSRSFDQHSVHNGVNQHHTV